jgi:hypothetical protein
MAIGPDSQRLYAGGVTTYASSAFYGERGIEEEGEMSRLYALALFVLGESVLASLSFGVAAAPALVTFVAGSFILTRGA